MRKLIFIGIFLWMPMSVLAIDFAKDSYEMVYLIKIGEHDKGVVHITKKKGGTLSSIYYGLQKRDKFPFFSPKKSVTFDKAARMLTLKVGTYDLSFHYDLSKLHPKQITRAGVAKRDIDNSVIVINTKRDRPILTFEKTPAMNLEVLITGLLTGALKNNQQFLLYEPQTKKIIRAKLVKKGKSKIFVLNKQCNVDNYDVFMMRANKQGKPLMTISMVDSIPVEIKAASKRWSLELRGLGNQKLQKLSLSTLARNKANNKLTKKIKRIGNATVTHTSKVKKNTSEFLFDYTIVHTPKRKGLKRQAIKLMAKELFFEDSKKSSQKALKYTSGKYTIKISPTEICSFLRKKYKKRYNANCTKKSITKRAKLSLVSVYQKIPKYQSCTTSNGSNMKPSIICTLAVAQKTISISPFALAKEYFKAINKNIAVLQKAKVFPASIVKESKLHIWYTYKSKVTNAELKKAGWNILAKKLGVTTSNGVPSSSDMVKVVAHSKGNHSATISDKYVRQSYCKSYTQRKFRVSNGKVNKKKACQLTHREKVNKEEMSRNAVTIVRQLHPELKIMQTKIIPKFGKYVQYQAINAIGGNKNACFK